MKRIKAACIYQTLHFMLKEGVEQDIARKAVEEEVRIYKQKLDQNRVKYKILKETVEEDGSVMLEIKKQYNMSPVGDYLD